MSSDLADRGRIDFAALQQTTRRSRFGEIPDRAQDTAVAAQAGRLTGAAG